MRPDRPNIVRCGLLLLDPDRQLVEYRGAPVQLAPYEFAALFVLAASGCAVWSKTALINLLGNHSSLERSIDSIIKRIRRKLLNVGCMGVVTVYQAGFKYDRAVADAEVVVRHLRVSTGVQTDHVLPDDCCARDFVAGLRAKRGTGKRALGSKPIRKPKMNARSILRDPMQEMRERISRGDTIHEKRKRQVAEFKARRDAAKQMQEAGNG